MLLLATNHAVWQLISRVAQVWLDASGECDYRTATSKKGQADCGRFRCRKRIVPNVRKIGVPCPVVAKLTGKGVQSGNNVSHANNKTKRKFLPNLCNVTLISDVLGQRFRLRVSAAALRSVEHRGGLDAFLLKAEENELSMRARLLRRQIAKKTAAAA